MEQTVQNPSLPKSKKGCNVSDNGTKEIPKSFDFLQRRLKLTLPPDNSTVQVQQPQNPVLPVSKWETEPSKTEERSWQVSKHWQENLDLYICIQPDGSIVLQGIVNESTKELHVQLSNLCSKELKDQIAVQQGPTYCLKEQFALDIEEMVKQLQMVADKVSAVLGTTLRTVNPHQNFTRKAKSVNSQGQVVMYYNLLVQNTWRMVTSLECNIQEQLLFKESPIQASKQMPQAKKEPLPSQSQPELESGSKTLGNSEC